METICKVCGGPHITGACTEKHKSGGERLTDYRSVTLKKVAEYFNARADVLYATNDNAAANFFSSIAENLEREGASVTDLKRALKELEVKLSSRSEINSYLKNEGLDQINDDEVIYSDTISMDSMMRFLRDELYKRTGK